MQLTQLHLTNFLRHADTTIPLSARVTMVFGRNASGKTSIANAIEFALTGRCRGIRFKRDAPILVRSGSKSMSVALTTSDNEFLNTQREPRSPDLPWPAELLGVLCDPMRLIHMGQSDRQSLFREVLQSEVDLTLLEALLESKAVKKSDIDELWAEVLAFEVGNIDKAEREAVECRRSAKRARDELSKTTAEPIEQTVTLGEGETGKEYDLRKFDAGKIRLKLAELETKLAKLPGGGNLLSPKKLKADLQTAEAAAKALVDARREIAEQVSNAKEGVSEGRSNAAMQERLAKGATDAENESRSLWVGFNEGSGHCPHGTDGADKIVCPYRIKGCVEFLPKKLCPGGKNPIVVINDRVQENIKKYHADARKAREAADEAAAAAEKFEAKLNRLQPQLAKADAALGVEQEKLGQIKSDLKAAESWDADKDKIDGLVAKAMRGRELLAALERYNDRREAAGSLRDRTKRIVKEIDSYDRLVKLIQGPIRKHLAAAVEAAVLDPTLVGGWHEIARQKHDPDGTKGGFELRVEPDGLIVLNERPIEVASASEQWRAGLAIADLLARSAGVGWIVADGCEILDKDNRRPVNKWAMRAKENGYSNILMLATIVKAPEMGALPEGMAAYWLDHDGTVARIGGSDG